MVLGYVLSMQTEESLLGLNWCVKTTSSIQAYVASLLHLVFTVAISSHTLQGFLVKSKVKSIISSRE